MEKTEYVYGYSIRNGQPRPTVTIAIVPFPTEDGLTFGIGVTRCSIVDMVEKVEGRTRAEARAIASHETGNTLMTKPSPVYPQKVIGISCDWEDAVAELDTFEFTPTLKERAANTLRYLARKHMPEIVEA